ncbi:hypothetical protein Misp02_08210 [Microtetraspora sp. NBRC 16547]|nr:hypothetical protein Misp02_08210 [Microtetraspora sp. NBRC 16547]
MTVFCNDIWRYAPFACATDHERQPIAEIRTIYCISWHLRSYGRYTPDALFGFEAEVVARCRSNVGPLVDLARVRAGGITNEPRIRQPARMSELDASEMTLGR